MTMYVDMSKPVSRTKDFFPSPALSLSLAGVFRGAQAAGSAKEGGGESLGGSREDILEISSENTGVTRSEEEGDLEGLREVDDGDDKGKKKKRKKYHRHTTDQIKEMEALFKESPHPDEKQRQQLSKHLGLAPRQVKFWFQNRRTQIKAIQERHENSLLKTEVDRLRDENRSLRDNAGKNTACSSCGFVSPNIVRDAPVLSLEEQQLRIENAKLKAEIEKLRSVGGGTTSPSSSCSDACGDQKGGLNGAYSGLFGVGKERVMETARAAVEELRKMASAGEPLWVRSVETGREILNYDEYVREFGAGSVEWGAGRGRRSIEASRETGAVFVDLPKLIQSFMDVNQWKEMFPSLIAKAATLDVICNGEGDNKNGATQLMLAEVQMLTPMLPSREFYFIRHCKQLSEDTWAVVDVSVDKPGDAMDAAIVKCRKRPSGCIIQDKCNGHCTVIWVEHLESQKTTVQTLYRSIVSSGMAFGAKRWITTLQLQCERLVFFMATNVPTKDSTGVATLAGRKSMMKLAQRMNVGFCRAVGATTDHAWTKVLGKEGEGMRVATRKNLSDPGEPIGVIVCAVASVWLPVSPLVLFDFLREDGRKNERDVVFARTCADHLIANIAKAQDRGNAVTVHATSNKDGRTLTWVLQDTCINTYEAMVVYSPVEVEAMQLVMTGCDSSAVPVLPSGYAIIPDGVETRPLVLSSRTDDRATEGGSILTVAFQTLACSSPAGKPSIEAVESASALVAGALRLIKTSLQCED